MKKILLSLVLVLFMFTNSQAKGNDMGWTGPITGTLAASASAYSEPFNMSAFKPNGFFSLHLITTGTGTCTVTYELSNKSSASADFVAVSVTAIATAQAAGSGFYQFPVSGEVIFAKWIRLKFTEAGGANSVTYTAYPNIQ
jgi:hypothetical protein